jgi:hypothetical protein
MTSKLWLEAHFSSGKCTQYKCDIFRKVKNCLTHFLLCFPIPFHSEAVLRMVSARHWWSASFGQGARDVILTFFNILIN